MKILSGHVSPETAYLIDDYPYGFRLRCKMRYWLEYKEGKGFRLWSQTTNPKRGDHWNTAKPSTYCRFGGCMYLNDEGRVTWSGLSEYTTGAEARAWAERFGEGVPEAGRATMRKWVASKLAYDAARMNDDPLSTGLKEGFTAFVQTK
jgi:hypothetical protein